MSGKEIKVPQLCKKHVSFLVHQSKYKETDSWQSMLIVSNMVLFQAVTATPRAHKQMAGDITKIETFGCLACYKPDAFGEIVEAAKSHDLGKIKALGEKYLAEGQIKITEAKTEFTKDKLSTLVQKEGTDGK